MERMSKFYKMTEHLLPPLSLMLSRSQSERSGWHTRSSLVFGSRQQDANSANRATELLVERLQQKCSFGQTRSDTGRKLWWWRVERRVLELHLVLLQFNKLFVSGSTCSRMCLRWHHVEFSVHSVRTSISPSEKQKLKHKFQNKCWLLALYVPANHRLTLHFIC